MIDTAFTNRRKSLTQPSLNTERTSTAMSLANVVKPIPNPPIGIGRCETCRAWLSREKQIFYLSGDGTLTPSKVADMAGGVVDLGKTQRVQLAPCTIGPIWHPVVATHWCHQHATGKGEHPKSLEAIVPALRGCPKCGAFHPPDGLCVR